VLADSFTGAAGDQQVLCCPRSGYQRLQHTGSYGNSHDGHSRERHIEFHCEDCGKDAACELVITESKGKVFVDWREPQWKTDFVTDCVRVAEGLISYNQLQSKYKVSLADWEHVAQTNRPQARRSG
jgi:hypothetical protein